MPITDDSLNFRATSRDVRGVGKQTTPPDNLASRGLRPIPVPRYCDEVSNYTLEERFTVVLEGTLPLLSGAIQKEFAQVVSPTSIGIIVGALVVWVGSHAVFGAGLVVDFIAAMFFCVGVLATGAEIVRAGNEFIEFMRHSVYGQNKHAMRRASQHLADCISMVGVGVILALIFRQAKAPKRTSPNSPTAGRIPKEGTPKTGPAKPKQTSNPASTVSRLSSHATEAGMLVEHAKKFARVAMDEGVIIMVRFTNPRSAKWIRQGYPAKPFGINAKTDKLDGIVTIKPGPKQGEHMREAFKKGLFVVDDDLVPRNSLGKPLELPSSPGWDVKPGQIIDPTVNKPLVGDSDLMGVVRPSNTGQNIAARTAMGDLSNPIVTKVRNAVNALIGQKRVMHGAHDNYKSIDAGVDKTGDGVIAFLPDGSSRALRGSDEVKAFYRNELGGRQTAAGRYEVPSIEQARAVVARQDPETASKIFFGDQSPRTSHWFEPRPTAD